MSALALSKDCLGQASVDKPDLSSHEHIAQFVEDFYRQMLADQQLAPLFLDVANIDLSEHLPRIVSYWEKLLLGKDDYQRHTMNIHREVDAKQEFTVADFQRWFALFEHNADASFSGEKTERAKRLAKTIANNMAQALGLKKPLL